MTLGVQHARLLVHRSAARLGTTRTRYRGRVRFSELFDDLEAQVNRVEREEFDAEVASRVEAERAAVTWGAILVASVGDEVRLTLLDGEMIAGRVEDAAEQWVHVVRAPRAWIVPAGAVAIADVVRAGAPQPGTVERRLTVAHALRGIARSREVVRLRTVAGTLQGRVSAVGADHVRVGTADGERLVSLAALLAVEAGF